MTTVEQYILDGVQKRPLGTLFFAEDFLGGGTPDAVRKALQRIDKKGIMKRVAQGIYVCPKTNAHIGPLLPTAEEIAEAIVRRDHARTVPTGATALHALGLSNQIPMNVVLLTDGSPREIRVGRRKIKFKKTTPRNLSAKGEISRLVIQALKALGKDKVSQSEEDKIIALLKKEKHGDLIHDIGIAPEWIQQIMKKAL